MDFLRGHKKRLLVVLLLIALIIASVGVGNAADFTGKKIVSIEVSGNITVPESKILETVKVSPGDLVDPSKIKQDMKSIYEMGSFFDVAVNFTEVPEGVTLTYVVLENPALKEVVIQGNTKISTDKLKSLLTIHAGSVLDTKLLNANARAIEAYYHDQGFILARVSDVSMSPSGVVTLSINEGLLEGIVVKGNDKTKNYVITREMKLKTGDVFNAKDAKRSMQKVYNLGYFEDVNMKLNPGKDPNAVVLETDVVEKKNSSVNFGVGYSHDDGVVYSFGLGEPNFNGTGDSMKVELAVGGYTHGLASKSFSYTHPWLDSKQTSVGFSIYDSISQYNDYGLNGNNDTLRSTYDRKEKGFDITLGRPYGDYIQNYITFRSRNDTYAAYVSGPVDYTASTTDTDYNSDYNSQWLKDNFGLTRSITLTRVIDTRDNVFDATEGARLSMTGEFAGGALGGDFDYKKYFIEGRQYFKVGSNQVLAFRLQGGYGTGNIPDIGMFSVGGSDTLRGYDENEFKGNKLIDATAEYRFPLAKSVKGVVFVDDGKAWGGAGYSVAGLKEDVGVGLRITVPILGAIRLDYAKGNEGSPRTQFGFGAQF